MGGGTGTAKCCRRGKGFALCKLIIIYSGVYNMVPYQCSLSLRHAAVMSVDQMTSPSSEVLITLALVEAERNKKVKEIRESKGK